MSNFRRVAVAAAAAGVMASALVGASPAGAQEETETLGPLAVTPTSGPSGTVISVSGQECDEEEIDLEARFALIAYDPDHGVQWTMLDESAATPDSDGDWSGELTVPDGADPEIDAYILAECTYDGGEGLVGEYESVPFDVTAGEGTPTTTAPAAPETPATVAPVATPVVAQPSFTG